MGVADCGKWNWSYQRYLDPDTKDTSGQDGKQLLSARVLPFYIGALPGAEQPLVLAVDQTRAFRP